jgi:hypothetical protein
MKMGDTSLYDEDILAWSEHQAEVLRRLASRQDLPNDLDLENIVEEIESVGRSEFNTVKSLLRLILIHLVKTWCDPDAEAVVHWASEVRNWHFQLLDAISPAMKSRIDLDQIWQQAVRQAHADLLAQRRDSQAGRIETALDRRICPVGLEALCHSEFDLAEALATLPP